MTGHRCLTTNWCDYCESAAEARKDADQEPYDDNGARADEYERGIGL